jgi:multiple sugar transport system permease protein/sn-glycerol 3-phosphate transport system permease protein
MATNRTGIPAEAAGSRQQPAGPVRPRLRRYAQFATPYIFIGPSLFGVLAFSLVPVLMAGVISFTSWNLLSSPHFIGTANYTQLAHDSRSLIDFARSGEFVLLTVPLQTALAIFLALLMRRKFPGRTFFRAIFVLPWLSTPVVVAVIWRFLIDPTTGPFAQFLSFFGIHTGYWLQSTTLALPAIALMTAWQYVGYNALFFLAGLQSIPEYLDEAAMLDGAKAWQRFWRVTLPLLGPTTLFVVITNVIGGFQAFDMVYILTQGGPNLSTEVVNYRIYELGFQQFDAGYASALAMVLFLIILLFTIVQLKFANKHVTYDVS